MKRSTSLLIVAALTLAACGTGETGATVTTAVGLQTPEATEAPTASATEATETGEPAEAAVNASSGVDGPAAPDFTLALGDGSSFTLSATDRPVYLVFWAEW